MKIFNLDLHVSVIADLRYIFEKEGHEVVNWSLSGHTWVFGKRRDDVKIITQDTWNKLDMKMIDDFCREYGDFLSSFDAFIVAFPISFALIFERFNKPIIALNCIRYETPFFQSHDNPMLKELHACLVRLQSKGLLRVVANNKVDFDYFKLGNPSIDIKLIPSLCSYTQMNWKGVHNNLFLVYTNEHIVPNHPLIIKRSQIGNFRWDNLMAFRGIVHIPYESTTMSVFEHITSKIPLFFPTKRFLKELWSSKSANCICDYWKGNIPPHLEETRSYDFWIDRADYYGIEGYYYFDSVRELFELLTNFKDELFELRNRFVDTRKQKILDDWHEEIETVKRM